MRAHSLPGNRDISGSTTARQWSVPGRR
jgi:hypothetical protein